MDKTTILKKINKFCPPWLKRPDEFQTMEEILHYLINQVLPGFLDMKVELMDDNKIIGTVPYKNETANVLGYMHGGTIFTLGDTLGGAYVWAVTDENTMAVTSGCEIKYLKPVKTGTVKCTVTEKFREGRKMVLEAHFENDNNELISQMTMNYLLITAGTDST